MDRQGNICVLFGKLSFEADKLVENANVIINAIRAERPSSTKGVYIRKLAVSSTMGVPVKVAIKE